jgi:hypothetical protein
MRFAISSGMMHSTGIEGSCKTREYFTISDFPVLRKLDLLAHTEVYKCI